MRGGAVVGVAPHVHGHCPGLLGHSEGDGENSIITSTKHTNEYTSYNNNKVNMQQTKPETKNTMLHEQVDAHAVDARDWQQHK